MKAQPYRPASGYRRPLVGLAVAAALSVSGCAAGRYAETRHEKTTLDGTNANAGPIGLRGLSLEAPAGNYYLTGSDARVNLVLVNNGDAADRLTGISTGSAAGWAAYSSRSVANSVHASANASASSSAAGILPSSPAPSSTAPATAASGSSSSPAGTGSGDSTSPAPSTSAALPAGTQSVTIPAGGRVSYGVPEATGGLLLTGLRGRIYPGTTLPITFTFARAGSIRVAVPVQVSNSPGVETG